MIASRGMHTCNTADIPQIWRYISNADIPELVAIGVGSEFIRRIFK